MFEALFASMQGAYSANTIRAYQSDVALYLNWCNQQNQADDPFRAALLAIYIKQMADHYKSATIRRRIRSISSVLLLSEQPDITRDPKIKLAMKKMHRQIGRAQRQATPLTREILDQLKRQTGDNLRGHRDRLLLQLGYESMRRRSEICSFNFEDLIELPTGKPALQLRRSKTDQDGRGTSIAISNTLAQMIQSWGRTLKTYQLPVSGALLRGISKADTPYNHRLHAASINPILRRLQHEAGLNHLPPLSGHSFRVGAALDLLKRGVDFEVIMLRGGWRSPSTALSYLRTWAGDGVDLYIEEPKAKYNPR